MTLGADDYLTKPFTQDELLEAIYARLDKQAVMNRQSQAKLDNLRSSIALSLPYQLLTPLNRIQRSAQMLCEEHNSIERPQILEIAQEIYTLSQVLHRLTQNFLFYALLEVTAADPGQVEALRRSKTHFSQRLITEVALAKAKQIARETDLQLELQEAALSILEANLAKIIEELLDNAFKFSQPGTPIQITSRLDQDKFMLCVIDQGCGMTSDQIANLGAYMQFEQKLSEQQESGAGLGLTIVKRLVELHGGRLVIHSIPCQQTTIRVVLPI
jgi:signal transduction histidine kinase